MITRKDLVEALRVLHEADQVTKIVTRAKRIDVHYMSDGRDCLLVLPNPPATPETPQLPHHVQVSNEAMDAARKAVAKANDNNTNTNKNRTKSKPDPTKTTTPTPDNRSEGADPVRGTKGRQDHRIVPTTGVLNRGS